MASSGLRALALVLLAAGCGGDDDDLGTRIDCAWFAGDNCWKASVAAAVACTDASATGTFDGTRTTCSYGDGTTVVQFASPAPQTVSSADGWDFTVVTSTATSCARYTDSDAGLTLTTSLGTFSERIAGMTLVLTCPDGSRYNIGAMDALSCDWADLPGSLATGSGTLHFALLGAPQDDSYLWRCAP